MAPVDPLPPDSLYRRCDPERFGFATTAEVEAIEDMVGQDRAVEAVRFGIGMRRRGYNLFVLGPPGSGKHTMVHQFLDRQAAGGTVPPDWCYVHNFDEEHKPRALKFPPGKAGNFADDMDKLIEELRSAIPAAFESEDYRTRRQVITEQFKERHEQAFGEIQRRAEEKNIALIRTPAGIALGPMRNGEVISAEEFRKLPEDEQEETRAEMDALQQKLQETLRQVPRWDREQREQIRELDREVTRFAVGHLIDELRKAYAGFPAVLEHLSAVEKDVVENARDFLVGAHGGGEGEGRGQQLMAALGIQQPQEQPSFRRYQVNVIIDNGPLSGAPVIYEDHPTHPNLIGRVEHLSQFGALVTDFNLIKAGALHRANGGYLVVDARKLLTQPYAWEELKRVLRSGEIHIESLGQMLSLVSTVSLEPEPIPLDVKIVLVGQRVLYYLLSAYDPDFDELFKVAADFESDMPLTDENVPLYARLVGTIARKDELKPFERDAVARVIEHSARLAGDSERMTMHMQTLADLLREADHWSGVNDRTTVTRADVQSAVDAQFRRVSRVRERMLEEIRRGTILIDTDGAVPGQINALAALILGNTVFARPHRVTARVRLGSGRVVDIEREAKLGGPLHSKGVLILSGFLGAHYAPDRPLSLSASVVFEQTYGGVEGDSASLAETCALLSALAEAPIRQSLAVTGSVNQHGKVQPIGAVNEKIEGFFDVCAGKGMNGRQGVIIPRANVKHLMLRHDVVKAAEEGRFHIYAVETVDEAVELLTGLPAGERDHDGHFPEDSFNARVEHELIRLSERARRFQGRERKKRDERRRTDEEGGETPPGDKEPPEPPPPPPPDRGPGREPPDDTPPGSGPDEKEEEEDRDGGGRDSASG